MSRYIVSVCRVEHRVYQIEIEADTPEEAHDTAVDKWAKGNRAFSEIGCLYDAEEFIQDVEEKREVA